MFIESEEFEEHNPNIWENKMIKVFFKINVLTEMINLV